MIGLDTNLLVRLFTGDHPAQIQKVDYLLEKECSPEDPGFVTSVTLVELTWTLRSHYQFSKEQIVITLETILRSKDLILENEAEARRAWASYSESSCDFPDAFIGEISKTRGCATTYTLDKQASKLPTYTKL